MVDRKSNNHAFDRGTNVIVIAIVVVLTLVLLVPQALATGKDDMCDGPVVSEGPTPGQVPGDADDISGSKYHIHSDALDHENCGCPLSRASVNGHGKDKSHVIIWIAQVWNRALVLLKR